MNKIVFDYLKTLEKNNNREWFGEHKDQYEEALAEMKVLAEKVYQELTKTDVLETPSGAKSLHRIYRDVRFKKDKTPYKINFSSSFKRATATRRGSYYFHIQPGNSFVAGGFWGPNPEDLKRIRERILIENADYKAIITSKEFMETFGSVYGEQVKTAPKGFDKEDENIDLVKPKQFILKHDFADKEVLDPNFHLKIVAIFQKMRPYFDLMSDFLTTNLNGELEV
ncbi:DUF2461 domain-containing protein [Lacihabitans lacunae]|uniref:DUF2461 domain-containing protein n=1 Tax=Lacihabitans lacunae TaxID=1028214 RepID=A0ABV7YYF4_9BACT